jgi:hypothetical protein
MEKKRKFGETAETEEGVPVEGEETVTMAQLRQRIVEVEQRAAQERTLAEQRIAEAEQRIAQERTLAEQRIAQERTLAEQRIAEAEQRIAEAEQRATEAEQRVTDLRIQKFNGHNPFIFLLTLCSFAHFAGAALGGHCKCDCNDSEEHSLHSLLQPLHIASISRHLRCHESCPLVPDRAEASTSHSRLSGVDARESFFWIVWPTSPFKRTLPHFISVQ